MGGQGGEHISIWASPPRHSRVSYRINKILFLNKKDNLKEKLRRKDYRIFIDL